MFPAQYLFADTGRSVHRNEKIVWKHYYFYSMNNYKQKIYLRIMYTNKMILLYYYILQIIKICPNLYSKENISMEY